MSAVKPPTKQTQRLFLALWPDEAVQLQLAAHARQWTWPAGCVQYQPLDWHVTLHFLGGIDASLVQSIAAGAAVPFQPFDLVLDQSTLWPHGLAVLCASKVPTQLWSLHDRLGQALRGLDLPVETRPYRPHVTLARQASAARVPPIGTPLVWHARSYALVISTGDKDHRYHVVRRYA